MNVLAVVSKAIFEKEARSGKALRDIGAVGSGGVRGSGSVSGSGAGQSPQAAYASAVGSSSAMQEAAAYGERVLAEAQAAGGLVWRLEHRRTRKRWKSLTAPEKQVLRRHLRPAGRRRRERQRRERARDSGMLLQCRSLVTPASRSSALPTYASSRAARRRPPAPLQSWPTRAWRSPARLRGRAASFTPADVNVVEPQALVRRTLRQYPEGTDDPRAAHRLS